ncbi:restriction endonuclease subunit S [Lactococcus petauri]|uniref:restriction endonuclease subunit S n=1 Tax=Lactococcus petauri TaxID=1940789 RepID=UPI0038576D80
MHFKIVHRCSPIKLIETPPHDYYILQRIGNQNKHKRCHSKDISCAHCSYYEKIPESWKIVSLGTIGKITSGGTPRSTEPKFYDGDIIWITPADMGKQQDSICFGDSVKHISILGLNSSSAQRIEGNSIVYSSRAPIGHINIVKSPYTTNQGCKSVTPYQVNVEWLYHTIKNETPNIIKEASGTTFLEVSATKFSETYVSLPPLEEQQRITVKVDSLNQMISQFDRLS